MPNRVKSFREINSGEDCPRAQPGFVKPIRDALSKNLSNFDAYTRSYRGDAIWLLKHKNTTKPQTKSHQQHGEVIYGTVAMFDCIMTEVIS